MIRKGYWCTEYRFDLVADKLQDQTALGTNRCLHLLEIPVDDSYHLLGRCPFDKGREVAQVREQHRYLPDFTIQGDLAGEHFVPDLFGNILAEGFLDELPFLETGGHLVDRIAHVPQFIVGSDTDPAVEMPVSYSFQHGCHVRQRTRQVTADQKGKPDTHPSKNGCMAENHGLHC